MGPAAVVVSEVTEFEKRQALEHVLSSSAFHRTDQLKSLLRFVCEREISGRGDTLDECTVAVEALGRPHDYSPFEDGTVRNRVHNLRRRLELYYDTENPAASVRIVVPKGSYRPLFERFSAIAPTPVTVEEAPRRERLETVQPAPLKLWERRITLRTACIAASVAVVAAAAMVVALRPVWDKDHPTLDPVISEAWGPLVAKDGNPLLCISTAAQLTLIQRPMDPHLGPTFRAPGLLSWYESLKGLPPMKEVFLGPSLTSPFWGDVAAAFAVNQLLNQAGITPELLPEAAVQVPALKKRNFVMFGRPGFSNTVNMYLADKPFTISVPDDSHVTFIANAHPRPGEPPAYDARLAPRTGNGEIAYGLITVMPGWGDPNLKTVVLSGTLSPGSQAASEFFSSPRRLLALRTLFRKEGYNGFPAAYQVVVRSNVFGTSALDVEYVTHRVISNSHP